MGRAYGKTLRSNLPSHFMNIAIALSTRYASNFGTAERDGLWTRRTLDDREDARGIGGLGGPASRSVVADTALAPQIRVSVSKGFSSRYALAGRRPKIRGCNKGESA
jgi:hypothetical protein